jgi:outer membrane protein insertion porin family
MKLKKKYIYCMDHISKVLFLLVMILGLAMSADAQDKIVNPDISYAGTPRTVTIGGINVSGVKNYEDYVLAGISGLSVGQQITVPG